MRYFLSIEFPDADALKAAIATIPGLETVMGTPMKEAAWQCFFEAVMNGPTQAIADLAERVASLNSESAIEYVGAPQSAHFAAIPGGHADFRAGKAELRIGYLFPYLDRTEPTYFLSIEHTSDSNRALVTFGAILASIVFNPNRRLPDASTLFCGMDHGMTATDAIIHCALLLKQ